MFLENHNPKKATVEDLIAHLKTIPHGQVTTHTGQTFDLNNGLIGLMDGHEEYLLELLSEPTASAIVRVFHPTRKGTIFHGKTGKLMQVPIKQVYGYFIADNAVYAVDRQNMEEATMYDSKTGARLDAELSVECIDAPILVHQNPN